MVFCNFGILSAHKNKTKNIFSRLSFLTFVLSCTCISFDFWHNMICQQMTIKPPSLQMDLISYCSVSFFVWWRQCTCQFWRKRYQTRYIYIYTHTYIVTIYIYYSLSISVSFIFIFISQIVLSWLKYFVLPFPIDTNLTFLILYMYKSHVSIYQDIPFVIEILCICTLFLFMCLEICSMLQNI